MPDVTPPAETPPDDTVAFTLDGREVTATRGEMVIAAAERAGTFIPRFCYHPRMKPVGVCRMCLVEISGPRGATLQPACFVEVQDGMEVTTTSEKVHKAQDGVLEFLLINHPLDCPVCDKGGECPLQDQTLAYGPGETRFVEEKRHFEKPIPVSELVLLDRERCIQCSRCTRFADEVAGEAQIDFAGRGELLKISAFPELPFSSYFSGNTVQICPVGALTASPYRFSARPWDLDQVESTCTTCSMGCRVAVQSSANRVTRLLGIDADAVNHGWLCDKGRFAYEGTNAADRLTEPLVRKDGELAPASWHEALAAVADGIREATAGGRAEAAAFLGGARLTNEGAYAWARLAKGVVGTDSVDAQLGDGLPGGTVAGLPRATIDDAVGADTVVLLGDDVRETVPVLFLRLRAAVLDGDLTLVEIGSQASSLTPLAAASLRVAPGGTAAAVEALAGGGAVPGIDDEVAATARRALAAGRLVVVAGRPSLAEDARLTADALGRLAAAHPEARFLPALSGGNVQGALDLGLAPGLLPGRVDLEAGRTWFGKAWGSVPDGPGRDARAILEAAAGEQDAGDPVAALVVLDADLLGAFPDARLARRALDGAEFVVALASAPSEVTAEADVVLPVAAAHERAGTTTNLEGRVSRLGQKLVPPGQAWPDWMVAAELAVHLGVDPGFESVGAVWDEIERVSPLHQGLTSAALAAPGAADGVVVPLPAIPVALTGRRPEPLDPIAFPGVESVERQGAPPRAGLAGNPTASPVPAVPSGEADGGGRAPRPAPLAAPPPLEAPRVAPTDSYSVRLVVGRALYADEPEVAAAPALAALVAPAPVRVHPHDLDDLGVAPGGDVRLRTATAHVVAPAHPDPSLPRGVVATEFGVPLGTGTAADLIDATAAVVELRLETP